MEFEVTKREVIFSIIIIVAMLGIGMIIGNKISSNIRAKNEVYNKSVTIETNDMFKYGLDTNIGDSFTYGELNAVDTVSVDDIEGYMYISRELEEYTRHTKKVRHTNNKGQTYYTTETYYTWDHVRTDSWCNNYVTFCGVSFPTKDFPIPASHHLKTESCGYHKRYNYSVVDAHYVGTLFADLDNNYICKDRIKPQFRTNITIDEALKSFTISEWDILFFWIPWIIVIGTVVFGFYYIDNRWLED